MNESARGQWAGRKSPTASPPGAQRLADLSISQMYQGIPRQEIPWFPIIINPEKCDHCLKCLDFCPNDVFEAVEGRLEVARPLKCLVGCSRCTKVCPRDAIHFMERRDLNMLLQQLRRQRAGYS